TEGGNSMPQHLRICMPGMIYHVTVRGNNRQKVFLDDDDYERFRSLLQRYSAKFEFKLYAYTLMPNHVHLLMETSAGGSISKIMHGINLSYAKYFNSRYDRSGHVWQGRFHCSIVDSEGYFLECMRYMDLNPVRARLVDHPRRYEWSSHAHYAQGRRAPFLTHHEIYDNLGETEKERRRVYREHVAERMSQAIEDGDPCFISRCPILGTEQFVERVRERFDVTIWPKYRRLLAKLHKLREA
ncbi:MAG: transposase, partial [Armatimonadetes bacterium]|nr:transposase [Armatimonadota bacterium]